MDFKALCMFIENITVQTSLFTQPSVHTLINSWCFIVTNVLEYDHLIIVTLVSNKIIMQLTILIDTY